MSQVRPVARRTAPAAAATGTAGPRLGLALAVIATAQLMVLLDATIVNVALPHIQQALGFSGSGLEWVVNAYALSFGGPPLLAGRAGDLLGRRRVFIAGLLLFSAASLAGGFATSQAWLLTARAVQGAGAATIAAAALALIATTFPEGPPRNRAMGVYAAMSVVGGAVGLIAGGLLTTYASWRWVMFVNVPIGLAAALAAPRVLSESARHQGRFDLLGAITGTGGLAALVYGLSSAATTPNGVSHWGDAKVVASLAASMVLLAAFTVIEARDENPLLPLHLLRDRDRTGANLIMVCVGTAIFGMFFFLTVFMQSVWGYSALKTGVAYLPLTAAIMVSSGAAAQLVPRIGARPLLLAGSPAVAGGMYWLSRLGEHSSYAGAVLGPMLVTAAGLRAAVRARHPGCHVAGPGRGIRGRGQPAQHRPADRRIDRARPARHRRLDRRRQQHPRQNHARRHGHRPGWPPGAPQPGSAHRAVPPRSGHRLLPRLPGRGRGHAARPGHHSRDDPDKARRPGRGPVLGGPANRHQTNNHSPVRRNYETHDHRGDRRCRR